MDPRLGYYFFRLDFVSPVPPHVFVAVCYRFGYICLYSKATLQTRVFGV